MPPTSRPNIPIIHNCLLAVYLLSEGALFNLAHNTIILINIWLNCNMSLIWNKDKLILGHFPRKKNNLIPMRWQRGRYDNLSRYIYIYIPSGYLTVCHGKSPFLSSVNFYFYGPSIHGKLLNSQMVYMIVCIAQWLNSHCWGHSQPSIHLPFCCLSQHAL